MVLYNAATKELTAKIVYYGPGLGGKTTNLQLLHDRLDPHTVGKLITLSTQTDRTIYFDLLPVELGDIKGYKIRFQLATVPGQTAFNETRKVVLRGADGIVFVADSQWAMLPKNLESWQNLKDNLKANGVSFESIPIVVQYNKRDLADILSVDAMQEALGLSSYPFVEAVASAGRGVTETFKLISKLTFVDLLRRLQGRKPDEAAAAPARPALTLVRPAGRTAVAGRPAPTETPGWPASRAGSRKSANASAQSRGERPARPAAEAGAWTAHASGRRRRDGGRLGRRSGPAGGQRETRRPPTTGSRNPRGASNEARLAGQAEERAVRPTRQAFGTPRDLEPGGAGRAASPPTPAQRAARRLRGRGAARARRNGARLGVAEEGGARVARSECGRRARQPLGPRSSTRRSPELAARSRPWKPASTRRPRRGSAKPRTSARRSPAFRSAGRAASLGTEALLRARPPPRVSRRLARRDRRPPSPRRSDVANLVATRCARDLALATGSSAGCGLRPRASVRAALCYRPPSFGYFRRLRAPRA